MIIFLATKQHAYTFTSLSDGGFGAVVPKIHVIPYEDALLADLLPQGTYVFTDIERLTMWERILAADIYRQLQSAGCRCLNDPARVMTRYTLLRNLYQAGINTFRAWRLDDAILAGLVREPTRRRGILAGLARWRKPRADSLTPRFPVFLRTEDDHDRPLTDLLATPEALLDAIVQLAHQGVPAAGVMIVEFCAEPLSDGIWAKMGTMRIGDTISTDHAVIEDHWCVRTGTRGLAGENIFAWEHEQVANNACAGAVRSAFEIAGIDYGRADHATVAGKTVIYEINTNPNLLPLTPQQRPIRDETLRIARERFADGLRAIDSIGGDAIPLARSPRAQRHANFGEVPAMQFRP